MEPILGQIQLFAFNRDIEGWIRCEGQILRIDQNTALFALIGTAYGGDGRTTFALPDLRDKEPNPHMKYFIASEGYFPTFR